MEMAAETEAAGETPAEAAAIATAVAAATAEAEAMAAMEANNTEPGVQVSRAWMAGGASILVLILAASAFYALRFEEARKSDAADALLQSGRTSLAQGVPDPDAFTEAAARAASVEQKALAELNLGLAYLALGDTKSGVDTLKRVSLTDGYPERYRVTAAENVIAVYTRDADASFARQEIFAGPVWGGFLTGSASSSIDRAVRNALSWMDSLDAAHPAIGVSYRLAKAHTTDLIGETDAVSRSGSLALAMRYLARGDAAYAAALAANQAAKEAHPDALPPYGDSALGSGLVLKARALADLYGEKEGNLTLDEVLATFGQGIALLERDPGRTGNGIDALYARYRLAAFLAWLDGKTREKDIRIALAPVVERYASSPYRESSFYQGFLKNYGTDPAYRGTSAWRKIRDLGRLDPAFRSVLLALGWKSSDFR